MKTIKAALLLGPGGVPDWLAEAIRISHQNGVEMPLVLRCQNPLLPRRPFKHVFYYLLNILVMRSGAEEKVRQLDELGLGRPEIFSFKAEPSGRHGWQRLPNSLADRVRECGCDVVIKAGMGLIENPDATMARLGMLSYHHGDPSRYRGRPAGFWEIMENEPTMGMMVQRLNDRLDAGTVLAFGRAKIYSHSYRLTLAQARRASSALLFKAIQAAEMGERIDIATTGQNYRLPSNLQVCFFGLKLLWAKLRRVAYGAFIQKNWRVGIGGPVICYDGDNKLDMPAPVKVPKGYTFLADCFWAHDGAIYAEALRSGSGTAEIIKISADGHEVVSDSSGHWSYPFSFTYDEAEWILPEVSQWSAPFMLKVARGPAEKRPLKGLSGERLVDPTLLERRGAWYLFAGRGMHANDQLHLWVSNDGPDGPYRPHVCSPVVIDVTCARMAGPIQINNGRVIRLGQNFSDGYGSAISVCEIIELTPHSYREIKVGKISMHEGRGPHTYGIRGDAVLFDWYTESFNLLAGWRRLLAKLTSLKPRISRPGA